MFASFKTQTHKLISIRNCFEIVPSINKNRDSVNMILIPPYTLQTVTNIHFCYMIFFLNVTKSILRVIISCHANNIILNCNFNIYFSMIILTEI